MKKFNFPFQKILDIKGKNREQAEWSYAKVFQHLRQEQGILAEMLETKEELQTQMHNGQIIGTTIKEISQSQSYINHLGRLVYNQLENIKKVEDTLLEKQKELTVLKVEEKKWMKLKERKYQDYMMKINDIEQKEMDEIATMLVYR